MEVHAHSHTADPDPSTSSGLRGKKMDSLFLMVFNTLPCCVRWFFGSVPVGA